MVFEYRGLFYLILFFFIIFCFIFGWFVCGSIENDFSMQAMWRNEMKCITFTEEFQLRCTCCVIVAISFILEINYGSFAGVSCRMSNGTVSIRCIYRAMRVHFHRFGGIVTNILPCKSSSIILLANRRNRHTLVTD